MIQITDKIRATAGFTFYVDKVIVHPTKPMSVQIDVVVQDPVKGHTMPFSITLQQSSMTIGAAEKHLESYDWYAHGKLVDKPKE